MEETDEANIVCLLGVACADAGLFEEEEKRKKSRRVWTKKWLKRREKKNSYTNLFNELRSEDEDVFRNYLRMTPELFMFIHKK